MRLALATLIIVLTGALAACGDDLPPDKAIAASDFSAPADGVAFRAPAGAVIGEGQNTQVAVLRRGDWTLVVSRFDREGADLPRSEADHARAANALEREFAARGFDSAEGVIAQSGKTRSVIVRTTDAGKAGRHEHFYAFGNEYVVDCVAAERDFERMEDLLCLPVIGSLELSRPDS